MPRVPGAGGCHPGWWVQEPSLPKRLQLCLVFKSASPSPPHPLPDPDFGNTLRAGCVLLWADNCQQLQSVVFDNYASFLPAMSLAHTFGQFHPQFLPSLPEQRVAPLCSKVTCSGPHPPRDLGSAVGSRPSSTCRTQLADSICPFASIDIDALN